MTEFDLPRDLSTLFIVVSTSSTTAFLQKLISVRNSRTLFTKTKKLHGSNFLGHTLGIGGAAKPLPSGNEAAAEPRKARRRRKPAKRPYKK